MHQWRVYVNNHTHIDNSFCNETKHNFLSLEKDWVATDTTTFLQTFIYWSIHPREFSISKVYIISLCEMYEHNSLERITIVYCIDMIFF